MVSIGLLSGCASGSQGDNPFDPAAVVEMTVLNRTVTNVTVFAWWRSGARVRLGELSASTNETFTTPIRSDEVFLSVDFLSNRRVGRPRTPAVFIPVQPGDRIEWEIRSTGELFYRRLAPD